MKILIYGAGVVGSTYGWQLAEAGYDVTLLVRKEKRRQLEESGINIHCADFRSGRRVIKDVLFRPNVIDELSSQNDFEYIIVATHSPQLREVLPILKESAGKAHILFFQNLWYDNFEEIATYLQPAQYFFGFPFMGGGGRDDKGINSAISGLKYSHTLLGEIGGENTPRVQKMVEALNKANLKPIVYKQIKIWLITHYAVAAGLLAGVIKAGGAKAFISSSKTVRETIRGIREGLTVCAKLGINPQSEKANKLYYLPLLISVSISKKVYKNDALQLMFDGHTQHSPNETRKMLEIIIEQGEECGVAMPYLESLQRNIIDLTKEPSSSY